MTESNSADLDDPAGAPVASPAEPPDDAPIHEPVAFTGDGVELFRIWIVNLFLTVITFGVYSAWAKVRRQQYFYRHTRLGGASFDYHGQPIAILKGRIVAFGLFLLYTLAGFVSPWMPLLVLAFVIAPILPWLLVRSLRFRFHNSSYRGLRFGFHGTTRGAYWVFMGLPVLSVLTFAMLAPVWYQRMKKYQHENMTYGSAAFTYAAPLGPFYQLFLAVFGGAIVLGIALVIAVTAIVAITVARASLAPDEPPPVAVVGPIVLAFLVPYVIGLLSAQAYLTARLTSLVWSHTRVAGHEIICQIQARRLWWILGTNLVGTICSLGFFRPFAQVRLARFVLGSFAIAGPLNAFVASAAPDVAATGEEVAEFFDFDIAF